MRIKVLACRTLQDEIEFLMDNGDLQYEVIWVESGLHNVPSRLHLRLQELIDQVRECDRLLLAFGRCGNSVLKLKSKDFSLVIPRVEDCISLFFGSDSDRNKYAAENAAYYLTQGWMRGERNLWVEYEHSVDRFGAETAREIADIMYSHYDQLALLDTGVYPMEELMRETKMIEDTLGLKRAVVPASLSYLRELLTGPWDEERFYVVEPNTEVTFL